MLLVGRAGCGLLWCGGSSSSESWWLLWLWDSRTGAPVLFAAGLLVGSALTEALLRFCSC